MTYGDLVRGIIKDCGAAEPLDIALHRLAGMLDTTDTDEGLESVEAELQRVVTGAIIGLVVTRGWASTRAQEGERDA